MQTLPTSELLEKIGYPAGSRNYKLAQKRLTKMRLPYSSIQKRNGKVYKYNYEARLKQNIDWIRNDLGKVEYNILSLEKIKSLLS